LGQRVVVLAHVVVIARAIAAEAGGDERFFIRAVDFISGELLGDETGIRLVVVEAADDVVAVFPGVDWSDESDMSDTKAVISSGVGSRPVKSSVTRRMSVAGSASGAGVRSFFSNSARTKRSRSFFGQAVFFTAGGFAVLKG
jgi:hypothetical protein